MHNYLAKTEAENNNGSVCVLLPDSGVTGLNSSFPAFGRSDWWTGESLRMTSLVINVAEESGQPSWSHVDPGPERVLTAASSFVSGR